MIALITLVLKVLCLGLDSMINDERSAYIMIQSEDVQWEEFHEEAVNEYMSIFNAIYGEVEYKVSKNGRSMVKGAYSNSFKFAPKGK